MPDQTPGSCTSPLVPFTPPGIGRAAAGAQAALFTRTPKLKEESSLLASLCSLLGALPRAGTPLSRQSLANLSRGELLCQAFEVYRDLVAGPRISFENLVFLVRALAEGEELALAGCEDCGALTVVDRITFKAHRRPYCASRADEPWDAAVTIGLALAFHDQL